MPEYVVNGQRFRTEQPLTPEQLQKLAQETLARQGVESKPDQGLDTEQSTLDVFKASIVDMLPELGGLSGAAAGAALGASAGSIVPGAGTVLGGIAGGAIGAFSGAGAGESARQLIEGEAADPLKAIETAAYEGILDVTGAKAIDIIADTGKLVGKALPKSKTPDDLAEITELQQELRRRGSTLRASQARPDDSLLEGLESAAEGGIGTKALFQNIGKAQQDYIDDQIEILIQNESKFSAEQTGMLLHNLVENTRVASSEAYGKVFDELEAAGKGTTISIQGIRNFAQRGRYTAMQGLTKKAEAIAKRGGKIPFLDGTIKAAYDDILDLTPNMSFSTAFSKLKSLKMRLTALRGDPATANDPAVAELASIVKNFENQMLTQASKKNPEIVDLYTNAMKSYTQSQDRLFNNTMIEALKKDPELVARTLLAEGRTTPIRAVRDLVKEAKKLRRSGEFEGPVRDPLNGLRRAFLEKALEGEGGQGIQQLINLRSKLEKVEFRRTFEELYPPETVNKIEKLIRQAEILARGPGGELALSIRSRQATAAESVVRPDRTAGQRTIAFITAQMPSIIAKSITDPARIDRLVNLNSVIIKAQREDRRIPAAAVRGMLTLAGDAALGIEDDRRQQEIDALKRQYGVE